MYEGRTRLLVVDDDNVSRKILCRILQNGEFETIQADSTREALRLLAEDPAIDLIVSDIMMPGLDGFEFVNLLRANGIFDGSQIIFCSSLCDRDTVLKARGANASGFILKPFDAKRVLETVQAAIGLLGPAFEKDRDVCKRLNIDEKTYHTMLSDLLREAEKLERQMESTETTADRERLRLSTGNVHSGAQNLGAVRLTKMTQKIMTCLENEQFDEIPGLAHRFGKERVRLGGLFQRRQELHQQALEERFGREVHSPSWKQEGKKKDADVIVVTRRG